MSTKSGLLVKWECQFGEKEKKNDFCRWRRSVAPRMYNYCARIGALCTLSRVYNGQLYTQQGRQSARPIRVRFSCHAAESMLQNIQASMKQTRAPMSYQACTRLYTLGESHLKRLYLIVRRTLQDDNPFKSA